MVVANAVEAAEKAAMEAAKEAAFEAAETEFLDDIVKICQEEGLKKGSEVFGEFGGQIGVEAALQFGKKAGVAKLRELVMEHAVEMGKAAGKEAGKPIIFIESQWLKNHKKSHFQFSKFLQFKDLNLAPKTTFDFWREY